MIRQLAEKQEGFFDKYIQHLLLFLSFSPLKRVRREYVELRKTFSEFSEHYYANEKSKRFTAPVRRLRGVSFGYIERRKSKRTRAYFSLIDFVDLYFDGKTIANLFRESMLFLFVMLIDGALPRRRNSEAGKKSKFGVIRGVAFIARADADSPTKILRRQNLGGQTRTNAEWAWQDEN